MKRWRVLGLLVSLSLAAAVLIGGCSSAAPAPTPAKPTAAPVAPAPAAPTQAPAPAQPTAASVAYPTKPINLMIPWTAGGTTDVGARILASFAEKELGQPVVPVNKEGAGSQVGLTELAQQKPDGYNLGFINLPAVNTILLEPQRKAAFTLDSFDWIVNHVYDPCVVMVKPDSPYKTLKDLVDDAKKRPGQLKIGTSGALTPEHLAALLFEEAAGIQFRIAHFAGSALSMKEFLAGNTDVSTTTINGYLPRMKSGEFRVLAVLAEERDKGLPDVPTAKELGYPSLVLASSRGVGAPKGLPEPIFKKLETAFTRAIENPGHVQKMQTAGFPLKMIKGDAYKKYVYDVHETSRKLVDLANKSK